MRESRDENWENQRSTNKEILKAARIRSSFFLPQKSLRDLNFPLEATRQPEEKELVSNRSWIEVEIHILFLSGHFYINLSFSLEQKDLK